MATENEVTVGQKKIEDKNFLNIAKQSLVDIVADQTSTTEILIRRGDKQFSMRGLVGKLITDEQEQTAFETTVKGIVDALIGPDDVTNGTLRKALADLIGEYVGDISAT